MCCRGIVGLKFKLVCFVVFCFSIVYVASTAFGESFSALLNKAERGDAKAQCELGVRYLNGKGVKKNYKKAYEWLEKAATQNYALALYNLGRMYENGLGITKDMNKALKCYQQAAENGNEQANETLARWNEVLKAPAKKTVPLAVYPFDDMSEEGKAPVSAIMHMMVYELHKTGLFRLLEREHLDVIAPNPNLIPAQYIMTGRVTFYHYSEKASGFALPILGISTKAKTAYVVLDIRIINVKTEEMVYAATQTGEATNKEKKSIGSSSKTVSRLLELAIRKAIGKHVSAIKALPL